MSSIEFSSKMEVELVDFMGGDTQVAKSAKVSYGNDLDPRLADPKHIEGLINFLVKNQHSTPLESSVFTYAISCPIFVSREFFRHRSASYNEISARYTKMTPKFYLPTLERNFVQYGSAGRYAFEAGTEEQFEFLINKQKSIYIDAWKTYEELLEKGIAKEVARNVLPTALYTRFYVTMNARNLMHFLDLRNADQALYEIREVAAKMDEFFAEHMPLTHNAYLRYQLSAAE